MSHTDMQGPGDDTDAYLLTDSVTDAIEAAVDAGDRDLLIEAIDPLHPADIADYLEQIGGAERREFLSLWGDEFDGEVLSEIDEGLRGEVLDALPTEVMAEAVRELDTDDVVDLIEDLSADHAEAVLAALEASDRVAVENSLTYPDDTAGRLMQRELVFAPDHWTVGQAIDSMRAAEGLPDQFYHVVLVDARMKPTGQVPLGRLMAAARAVHLRDVRDEDFRPIPVLQSQEDVAYAFNQYHMVSTPVIDGEGRLVGVITIDDAMAVLDEEHEEDILRLAGVGDESLSDRVVEITRQRFPWLFVNLVTAILASLVIDQFTDTIAAIVALAVLMPIVASMGGNAGTQSLTVAVRALATRDLTASNALRVVRRETLVGLINGVVFAVIIGGIGLAWFGDATLGAVLGVAMVINLVVAALAGILIPLGLDRVGVDPALASGAFVTTVTDVVGFLAFLGLAAALLA